MAEKRAEKTTAKSSSGFSEEEKAAMRERAEELKAAKRHKPGSGKGDEEAEVLAKIASMSASDRSVAERIHSIIRSAAPELSPRIWYGMPAYARDGHVVCFFQGADKFKTRYSTLGFSDKAALDDSHMWPTAFAIKTLGPAEEARIAALLKKAVG